MQTFNRESGQIYTETTSPRVQSMTPLWKRSATGRLANPKTFKNSASGSGTLRNMAMRACCWNIELFMPEALRYYGWEYAGMVYRCLKATETLTLAMWQIFHQAFPEHSDLSHHFRIALLPSTTQWWSIPDALNILSNSVLTYFCAHGVDLQLRNLIALMNIPSLAALMLYPPRSSTPSSTLTNHDLRNWTRAVLEKRAFKNLKFLFLCRFEPADKEVLRHFSCFPALKLLGIAWTKTWADTTPFDMAGWIRPRADKERRFSEIISENRYTMAKQAEKLYRYADAMSEAGRTDGTTVRLSLTCGSGGVERARGDMSWFVRDPAFAGEQAKRVQESQMVQRESGYAIKRRRIRQRKQEDMGSVLAQFMSG